MPEHQLTMSGRKRSHSGSNTHVPQTDTHTKIALAMAATCRHDKHLRQHACRKRSKDRVAAHMSSNNCRWCSELRPAASGAAHVGVGLDFQVKEVVTWPSSRPINQPAQPHKGRLLGEKVMKYAAHTHSGKGVSRFSSHTKTHMHDKRRCSRSAHSAVTLICFGHYMIQLTSREEGGVCVI